jgi:hypothetical protein
MCCLQIRLPEGLSTAHELSVKGLAVALVSFVDDSGTRHAEDGNLSDDESYSDSWQAQRPDEDDQEGCGEDRDSHHFGEVTTKANLLQQKLVGVRT